MKARSETCCKVCPSLSVVMTLDETKKKKVPLTGDPMGIFLFNVTYREYVSQMVVINCSKTVY